jgi:hypothetical protein
MGLRVKSLWNPEEKHTGLPPSGEWEGGFAKRRKDVYERYLLPSNLENLK